MSLLISIIKHMLSRKLLNKNFILNNSVDNGIFVAFPFCWNENGQFESQMRML